MISTGFNPAFSSAIILSITDARVVGVDGVGDADSVEAELERKIVFMALVAENTFILLPHLTALANMLLGNILAALDIVNSIEDLGAGKVFKASFETNFIDF